MEATKTDELTDAVLNGAVPGETLEVTSIVNRAKKGDAAAFGELMRLYERRVIAIGMQMGLSRDDALDACQNAFTKVFRYIGRFRSGNSFFKWLYRIAVHAIYDQMRWSRPPGVSSIEEIGPARIAQMADASLAIDRQVESADLAQKLMEELDCLTRQERIVFVLRDLQQMPTVDIGRILRISQVTVRRHCLSARKKLKDRLFQRTS